MGLLELHKRRFAGSASPPDPPIDFTNGLWFTITISGTSFTIPTTGSGYDYSVDWGDSNEESGKTGNATHVYASAGTYQIKIVGDFPKFFFNNSAQAPELDSIDKWGALSYSTNQNGAFWGCTNLTTLASDNITWFNNITNAVTMFFTTGITAIPSGVTFESVTNSANMFRLTPALTSLPSSVTFAANPTVNATFRQSAITTLPSSCNGWLNSITNGALMFFESGLTSLANGITFANLDRGSQMFKDAPIVTLPSTVTFAALTNGSNLFFQSNITTIPSGVTFSLVTNGITMFYQSALSSLANGVTFNNVENGTNMFRDTSITTLPSSVQFNSLNNGTTMFTNVDLDTARYSDLLVDLESLNPNNTVTFDGGNSQYNTTGETARNILTGGTRNWTITDNGLE
tara:strand:- start:1211 stop:2416 length:1206 start_codon:yes stop_codon:yes gene_type:complete